MKVTQIERRARCVYLDRLYIYVLACGVASTSSHDSDPGRVAACAAFPFSVAKFLRTREMISQSFWCSGGVDTTKKIERWMGGAAYLTG